MTFPLRSTRRATILGIGALLTFSACRPGWDALGTSPARAQANGVTFADALYRRYLIVDRAPFYAEARAKLGKRALAPSGVFDDTTAWTSRPDARNRFLMAEGVSGDGRYRFTPRVDAPYPDRLADARHLTQLTKLANDGEFEWRTAVDFAVGTMSPTDWRNGFRALLGSAEGRTDADLRADLRSTLPRTTTALGRMFSLDTLHTQRLTDGTSSLTIVTTLHPDWLQAEFPLYARFVSKYFGRAAWHIVLRDTRNVRWLEIRSRDRVMTVRLRVLDGGLVPLDGPARAMPDTLRMTIDASTKYSIFTVGFKGMQGNLSFLRSASEHGWAMRFDKAPDWQLPLGAAAMLRSPLRRPFEQGGIVGKVSFRTGAGGQTYITRDFRVAVQESAVTRFLGGLSGSAFSEFDGPAEREENRFNADLFQGMRDDLRGLRYGGLLAPGPEPR
ncbi:MAG: hypothetical protein V4813_17700 [Gemmatimonadota bacterium]